jgi:hypothetical protein
LIVIVLTDYITPAVENGDLVVLRIGKQIDVLQNERVILAIRVWRDRVKDFNLTGYFNR